MLHELLLALTGHSSPLLDDHKPHALTELLSPSERTLLKGLACLGSLHGEIRERCANVSSSHHSTICRAVCTSIVSSHLSRFSDKIVDVESSILRSDAKFVGAYDIVPLSAIVAAFDGWDRVLRWLKLLVCRIAEAPTGETTPPKNIYTGAQLIDYLKDEVHTGYPKIEQIASDLLKVAHAAWIRQLTPWLLYGRLPPSGVEDFFIQHVEVSQLQNVNDGFIVDQTLAPSFLDLETAHSILFIGRSLLHIERGHAKLTASAAASLKAARSTVLSDHLALLEALELPLTAFTLRRTVATMRSSLSTNALQKLLPFSDITRLLDVLRQFFLLERGEFAVALIGAADECLVSRHMKTGNHKDRGRLGGMMIKDGEVNSVLSRTWTSLVALQDVNDDDEDEDLEYAREVIDLSIRRHAGEDPKLTPHTTPVSRLESTASLFDDVLLATPTVLTVTLEPPLDIFLSEHDVQDYSLIHSFLLGIRRAHLHLAELWRLSTLRRVHPSPRPRQGNAKLAEQIRLRANARAQRLRSIWASISHARFFFAQMNDYLQGEVVQGCTETLQRWITPDAKKNSSSRPATASGALVRAHERSVYSTIRNPGNGPRKLIAGPIGVTESVPDLQTNDTSPSHDPEALAHAHRLYLSSLKSSLLLTETRFITSVRNLMTRIDHAVALTQRLSVVTKITQLGEQTLTSDSQSSHAKEESDLMKSLESVRKSIDANLDELIRGLRALDDRRRMGVLPSQRAAAAAESESVGGAAAGGGDRGAFVPWQGAGLARLLLRLESSGANE